MAREFASIRLSIWADDDFRSLNPRAQHLYFVLVTSPSLSFCGVADWRPKRISALAGGWSTDAVEKAATELEERNFVVIDRDTEEILLRSFVRTDGLMKQPNMAVAMATAHMATASTHIRAVVVDEVWRLSQEQPELACWGAKASKDLLARMLASRSKGPTAPANPSVKGSRNPSVKGSPRAAEGFRSASPNPSANPSPTTATATALDSSSTTSPTETALFETPAEDPPAETEGQLVNRLTRVYTDRVKLSKFTAVSGVVRQAVRASTDGVREYTDQQIIDGLKRLADDRRSVTVETLRVAIEGLPPLPSPRRGPAPGDTHAMTEAQLRMHALNPHLAKEMTS